MEVAGANRRWRGQFRCRGSRRESAVAQLFSLGILHVYDSTTIQLGLSIGDDRCSRIRNFRHHAD